VVVSRKITLHFAILNQHFGSTLINLTIKRNIIEFLVKNAPKNKYRSVFIYYLKPCHKRIMP
ncbi:MAG: hypothetical protein CMM82_04995, partial [Rhodospirillales bacterium]|nr:hypothetical protein [Rhodospirillales bacterium]